MGFLTSKNLGQFLGSIYLPRKGQVWTSAILATISGITKGSSFIILLPLLSLAGITDTAQESSRALGLVQDFWNMIGIPFTLYSSLAVYLLMTAFYAALAYFSSLTNSKLVESYMQTMRDQLFSTVLRAEWSFLKNSKSAHIFNNLITEIEKVSYSGQLVVAMGSGSLIFLFYLGTSLYVSFKMTVLAGLCFVPLFLIQKKLNWRTYKLGDTLYARHEALFSTVLEFVNSLKLAKSYNLQEKYEEEFQGITSQTARENIQWTRIQGFTDLLYDVGFSIIICGLIIWAFQYAKIPVVDLLLMVYIAMKLLPSISSLTRNYQHIVNTLPAFSGITQLREKAQLSQEITTGGRALPEELRGGIGFHNVRFGYENDPPVLDGFNGSIPFNKTTALVGPSGRGKSTLVELLLGLLKPQSGQILIDGTDLADLNLQQWRGATAYIPQECFLFHTTILRNLLWAKADATEQEIRHALLSAGGGFVYELPKGLNTVVGDQGLRLSGGERQRIALARALLRQPKVLILDEATNALDDANETIIKEAIAKLRGKTTILIISHDPSMSEGADVLLDLGERSATQPV